MTDFLRSVSVTPGAVLAGDSEEIFITCVCGADWPAGPARIVFDLPATLGTTRPTRLHPEDHGFVVPYVRRPGVAYRAAVFDIEGQQLMAPGVKSYRNMACRLVVMDLGAGLEAGDEFAINWGESRGGFGTGTTVTTVVPRPGYAMRIDVRCFGDPEGGIPDWGRDLPDQPRPVPDASYAVEVQVLPREARKLRLLRRHADAILAPLDRFDNAVPTDALADLVEADAPATRNAQDCWRFDAPHVKVSTKGLPLGDSAPMDEVFEGMNLYWGDIHTHTSVSNDCIEREKLQQTPADLCRFARERAALDFYAATDHHQPWDAWRNKQRPDQWAEVVEACAAADEPGRFLALPGIEFRCERGDTAVVFGWSPDYAEIDRPHWRDIRQVWPDLAGKQVLAIPHFHNPGRIPDWEWWQGPRALEPVLEIFSCHGSFFGPADLEQGPPDCKRRCPDRDGVSLLNQGRRYGICANSDGHKGHVGTNGVTAVFAKELTREALFEAYRARRTYATTNARIRLVFTGNGALMGSELAEVARKDFHVDVRGEGPLKMVELIKDGAVVHRWTPTGTDFTGDHATLDDGPGWYLARATQLDNHIAWSSPIWFG